MIEKLRNFLKSDSLCSFFMGWQYPAIIAFLVAFAGISGIDLYVAVIHIILAFTALFVTNSVKPILISFLTFVMQLSVKHAPFYPTYSTYYKKGFGLVGFILVFAVVFVCLVTYIVKNKLYNRIRFRSTPMLASIIVFSLALLMNGVASGKWETGDLVFGLANAAVYSLVFLLLYYGLENETSDSLASYFSYLSTLVSFVIISELIALFITNDAIFVGSSIVKTEVALGWGIWNLVGVSLSVLIPAIFYGVHNSKYPWYYFASATLTFVFAVLTMSRNALLFSALSYGACVIISCFKGKNRKAFRAICALGVSAVLLFSVVFFGKIRGLLADYFDRGLSDNGRYALWRAAFENFLATPIFGGGFYGFDVDDTMLYGFGPLAKQAHNTLLQLLSATGAFGLLSYLYYRYESLKPVFTRPSMKKTFFAMSIGVLLLSSLLDNFVFNIYPVFHYIISLVIIHRSAEEEK